MLTALALLAALPHSRAADPQPYAVTISPTGDATLDTALTDASNLVSLRETAPVGPFPLLARARGDAERFTSVLHGLGHYAAQIDIRIDGHKLDDPGLTALLDAAPATPPVPITVAITPGPVFHLRHITIDGDLPADLRPALKLAPGDPAVAATVLAAGAGLLAALRDAGHALAQVDSPIATLDPAAQALDVRFTVHAGPRNWPGPT